MHRPARRQPLVVATGVAVALAAAGALLSAGSPSGQRAAAKPRSELRIHRQAPSGGPAVTTVPDVRGRSIATADAILRHERFRVRVVRRSDPAERPDLVMAEHPAGGALVAPEVVIELVVNAPAGSS